MRDVVGRLQAGMSEKDVAALADERKQEYGFTGWYHTPEVYIGAATGKAPLPLLSRPSDGRKLEDGQIVIIDLGPASGDTYGDFGTSLVFGGGAEPEVLIQARNCVRGCCTYANRWKTAGEIWVYAKAWATNHRLDLLNKDSIGHKLLPKEGAVAMGFPRSAHLAASIGRNRMHKLNPERMRGMFAVRPHFAHQGFGAAFEEVVYVNEDGRWALGRDRLEEVGTL